MRFGYEVDRIVRVHVWVVGEEATVFAVSFADHIPVCRRVYGGMVELTSTNIFGSNSELPPMQAITGRVKMGPGAITGTCHALRVSNCVCSAINEKAFVASGLAGSATCESVTLGTFERTAGGTRLCDIPHRRLVSVVSTVCRKNNGGS